MPALKTWKPINNMVLIRKDEDKNETSGGIVLPDKAKIPVITARVLEIGPAVDEEECPIQQYYRVLVRPSQAVPLEITEDNRLYVIDADHILAYEINDTSNSEQPEDAEASGND